MSARIEALARELAQVFLAELRAAEPPPIPATPADDDPWLTTAEAAKRAGMKPATFEFNRCKGRDGPVYFKVGGRVRYRTSDVDKWMTTDRRTSTSAPLQPVRLPKLPRKARRA